MILVVEHPVDMQGRPMCQRPDYDRITNTEVFLELNDILQLVKIKEKTVGPEGKVEGCCKDNHVLKSISYGVEFPVGKIRENDASIVVENMLSKVDEKGFSKAMICAHRVQLNLV